MRKKLLTMMLLLVFVIAFAGCGVKATGGSNTATGSNTSTGTNSNDNSTGANMPQVSATDLEENITCSGAITALGKFVVFATNGNSIPVDMEIEVEFYDASGTIVGSANEELQAVGENAEVAVDMWSTPESFDNYKIYVDVKATDEISYFDKLNLTHSDNGENVAVQVTNNSDETIDYITVGVVYYQGDTVVGYGDGIESDVKPGRSANFNVYYPYGSDYNDVTFDNYKVFINEAYSYNW